MYNIMNYNVMTINVKKDIISINDLLTRYVIANIYLYQKYLKKL